MKQMCFVFKDLMSKFLMFSAPRCRSKVISAKQSGLVKQSSVDSPPPPPTGEVLKLQPKYYARLKHCNAVCSSVIFSPLLLEELMTNIFSPTGLPVEIPYHCNH